MPSFSWKLDNTYYDYVKNSQKIYEIRVLDDKRKLINIGDSIIFNNRDNIQCPLLSTKVSQIKIYGDFKEALEDTPLWKYYQMFKRRKGVKFMNHFLMKKHIKGLLKKAFEVDQDLNFHKVIFNLIQLFLDRLF